MATVWSVECEAVWVATMSFSLLGLLRRGLAKIQCRTRLRERACSQTATCLFYSMPVNSGVLQEQM